jgi:hypothetical protein
MMDTQYDVFCDESRQDLFYSKGTKQARYLCIGGLWIPTSERLRVNDAIKVLRNRFNVRSEFKWHRVSPNRREFYIELVKLFFLEDALNFRGLVIPANSLDVERFHKNDPELMFYKFYYQLLVHWLDEGYKYRIFVDTRTDKKDSRRIDLLRCLTNTLSHSDIICVEGLRSIDSPMLQLSDMLSGATCASFNDQNTSEAKVSVISEIKLHIGHAIKPTTKSERKFNVFMWSPRL